MESIEKIEELTHKYASNTLTISELDEFLHLVADSRNKKIIEDVLHKAWLNNSEVHPLYTKEKWEELYHQYFSFQKQSDKAGKVRPIFSGRKYRLVFGTIAALLIIAIVCSVCLFYFVKNKGAEDVNITRASVTLHDVLPGRTTATLTLSDGKKIILDSLHSADISVEKDGVYLTDKKGGKVCLKEGLQLSIYNTLLTRRGEQAPPVTLADGTKVWVNAASTLRFPLAFNEKTREVFLSGEAYFEVAKDPKHPFIVNTGNNKIEVLGTHFDVMAYNEDPYTYATLLKGSIRIINNNGNSAMLKPGQQGKINRTGSINIKTINADQSVAWMHGKLTMDNMDISEFLRIVSRWYDVDVLYKTRLAGQSFSGSLNKEVPLSQILSTLNTYGIHCKLENGKIVVDD